MAPIDETSREHREAAESIVRTLAGAGFVAYFAGGCVRDELLGLHPKDYDVATDAGPERVRELFRRVNEVGASFGVLLVRIKGVTIEVATFRREGGYSDRRRPDHVEYAGREEDARRRDFTINALYLDPTEPPGEPFPHVRGRVIDLVDGVRDLEAKTIRAVGDPDARLAEDDLRSLRAVRFAARLGFTIEEETGAAIRRHAGDLVGVSRERIGDELRLMLAHPSRAEAAMLMESLGLVGPALECRAGGVLDRGDRLLSGLDAGADFPTALAAWSIDRTSNGGLDPERIRDDAGAMTARLRSALCLSNGERDAIRGSLMTLARLCLEWDGLSVAGQKRLAVSPAFGSAMSILRVSDPVRSGSIEGRVESLRASATGLEPANLVVGEDLIGLGMPPGPRFREILDAVYDAQLDGEILDRAGAEAYVSRILGENLS
jgi:poly(A) polymerase